MKHLKSFNESNFTLQQQLETYYGKDVIEEYINLMQDIQDRCYDLVDLGFNIKIDWTYSTKQQNDRTPKIEVLILGKESLFRENYDREVTPFVDTIRGLIRELRFSSGFGFSGDSFAGTTKYKTYKILAQK